MPNYVNLIRNYTKLNELDECTFAAVTVVANN